MKNSRTQLAQIESDLEKVINWDFSNLEKYRKQKGKGAKTGFLFVDSGSL